MLLAAPFWSYVVAVIVQHFVLNNRHPAVLVRSVHLLTVFYNNNNNYYYYLLQLGCHPVEVVILHVYKT